MEETALQQGRRELIGFAFAVLTAVAVRMVVRYAEDPDALRTLRMRSALTVQRAADRAALECLHMADYARNVYERDCA